MDTGASTAPAPEGLKRGADRGSNSLPSPSASAIARESIHLRAARTLGDRRAAWTENNIIWALSHIETCPPHHRRLWLEVAALFRLSRPPAVTRLANLWRMTAAFRGVAPQ